MPFALRTLRSLLPPPTSAPFVCVRCGSSSSQQWINRKSRDQYSKRAKLMDLKSRAAFKLMQINQTYKIFKAGQTVVDLGFAPGSWSQVAAHCTSPGGRVLGLDIIPAQPPKGVSTMQGNFLSPTVQANVKEFLSDWNRGRPNQARVYHDADDGDAGEAGADHDGHIDEVEGYIDRERRESSEANETEKSSAKNKKSVHVVLSDMSEPWEVVDGFYKRSLTQPVRLMNTSGIAFRDHAGSMDLCNSALLFSLEVLKSGGSFVCKFYQGSEDQLLESKLKKAFKKVHRVKPDSSQKESKEMFFVALGLKPGITKEHIK